VDGLLPFLITSFAWGPFGLSATSNSTNSPSLRTAFVLEDEPVTFVLVKPFDFARLTQI